METALQAEIARLRLENEGLRNVMGKTASSVNKSLRAPEILPKDVVVELMEGNRRWVASRGGEGRQRKVSRSNVDRLSEDPLKPTPVKALFISCARSFAPLDSLFDAKPGELQVVRVCGYICGSHDGVLGSIEFALASEPHPPLIVVMGNSCNTIVADAVCQAMEAAGRGADIASIKDTRITVGGQQLLNQMMRAPPAAPTRACERPALD